MIDENLYAVPKAELISTNNDQFYDPKIISWSGRVGRLRYFVYISTMAMVFASSLLLVPLLSGISMTVEPVLLGLRFTSGGAFLIFLLIMSKRRLNDFNISGGYLLLFFIPIANLIFILLLISMPGDRFVNNYGLMPSRNSRGIFWGAIVSTCFFIALLI